MEARAFGLVAVFIVIVGFAGMLYYTEQIDEVSRDFNGAKTALEALGKTLTVQQDLIEQKDTMCAKIEGLLAKISPLEKALAETRSSTARLTEEVAAQETAFVDAVANVRQAAAGVTIGSMVLNSGKLLTEVKVKNVRADHLAVTHGLGVARLLKADLPFEIADRFKLEDPAPAVVKPKPPADGEPTDGSTASPAKLDAAAARAKTRELEGQIAKLRAQLTIASGSYSQLQRRAYEYRSQHDAARAAGRSSSHLIQANSVQDAADAMQKQMTTTKAKIDYLSDQVILLRSDVD